jgi:hypothetical protein
MKSFMLATIVVLAFIATASSQVRTAQTNASNDCFYSIEFQKPTDGAADLKVHLSSPLAPEKVQSILSQELRQAAAFSDRRTDIMAVALVNETRLPLPDGSASLVYNAANDRIVSGRPSSDAAKAVPAPSAAIGVALTITMEVDSRGELRMVGKTNLPGGMAGILELRCPAVAYDKCDSVVVSNGGFSSKWFSANHRPLSPGSYSVSFVTSPAAAQPQGVRLEIGKNGENLTGPFVTDRMDDNIVKYENTFVLK